MIKIDKINKENIIKYVKEYFGAIIIILLVIVVIVNTSIKEKQKGDTSNIPDIPDILENTSAEYIEGINTLSYMNYISFELFNPKTVFYKGSTNVAMETLLGIPTVIKSSSDSGIKVIYNHTVGKTPSYSPQKPFKYNILNRGKSYVLASLSNLTNSTQTINLNKNVLYICDFYDINGKFIRSVKMPIDNPSIKSISLGVGTSKVYKVDFRDFMNEGNTDYLVDFKIDSSQLKDINPLRIKMKGQLKDIIFAEVIEVDNSQKANEDLAEIEDEDILDENSDGEEDKVNEDEVLDKDGDDSDKKNHTNDDEDEDDNDNESDGNIDKEDKFDKESEGTEDDLKDIDGEDIDKVESDNKKPDKPDKGDLNDDTEVKYNSLKLGSIDFKYTIDKDSLLLLKNKDFNKNLFIELSVPNKDIQIIEVKFKDNEFLFKLPNKYTSFRITSDRKTYSDKILKDVVNKSNLN